MTYSPLIPFSSISNISISVKRSNFTLSFLKLLAMLILVRRDNEQNQAPIFQDTYFDSSYNIERTNCDIRDRMDKKFYSLYKLKNAKFTNIKALF